MAGKAEILKAKIIQISDWNFTIQNVDPNGIWVMLTSDNDPLVRLYNGSFDAIGLDLYVRIGGLNWHTKSHYNEITIIK